MPRTSRTSIGSGNRIRDENTIETIFTIVILIQYNHVLKFENLTRLKFEECIFPDTYVSTSQYLLFLTKIRIDVHIHYANCSNISKYILTC